MESKSIAVILPTIGRSSLARALASIREQMLSLGDEVLVIGDGHQPSGRSQWEQTRLPGRYWEIGPGPHHDWGHTARNQAMPQAKGDYLLYLDDDDVYVPGAFQTIRAALAQAPGRPHMFRMRSMSAPSGLVWHTKGELVEGNVSTQIFVHPNVPERCGRWGSRYEGDFDFIRSTLELWPADALVWREEVICSFDDDQRETPKDLFEQHRLHPRNQGAFPGASVIGTAASGDGVSMTLHLGLARPFGTVRVEWACHQHTESSRLAAFGSLLTELIRGREVDRARSLTADDLLHEFGLGPPGQNGDSRDDRKRPRLDHLRDSLPDPLAEAGLVIAALRQALGKI